MIGLFKGHFKSSIDTSLKFIFNYNGENKSSTDRVYQFRNQKNYNINQNRIYIYSLVFSLLIVFSI